MIIANKIFVTKTSDYENCRRLEVHSAEIKNELNFEIFKSFKECKSIGIGAGRIQRYNFNGSEGILITTNDSDNDVPGSKAQNDNSIFGKIVFQKNIPKNSRTLHKCKNKDSFPCDQCDYQLGKTCRNSIKST